MWVASTILPSSLLLPSEHTWIHVASNFCYDRKHPTVVSVSFCVGRLPKSKSVNHVVRAPRQSRACTLRATGKLIISIPCSNPRPSSTPSWTRTRRWTTSGRSDTSTRHRAACDAFTQRRQRWSRPHPGCPRGRQYYLLVNNLTKHPRYHFTTTRRHRIGTGDFPHSQRQSLPPLRTKSKFVGLEIGSCPSTPG